MKRIINNIHLSDLARLHKVVFIAILLLLSVTGLQAQSGTWNGWREMAYDAHVTDGSGGYFDWGSGVIQLTNNTYSGCTASAVHLGSKYNHCDSNFSKCYRVLFGCGDADGMAFSFSYGCNQTDNSWQVWGCGGGLGYRNGCAWNQGVTIEFDTYNNGGASGFDGSYAGTGTADEIAIHKNLEATDGGKMTAVSVPDLEDGLEHMVCINYDRTSHVISVTIDGINRITYDLDAGSLNPSTYFSGCELMATWSAGTNAGMNYQVVSEGTPIINRTGQLCPQMLPVQFLDVKAKAVSSSVMVNWSTASEKSNAKFIVERSHDSFEWVALGEVGGAGNSGSVREYSFPDHSPLDGAAYYRIKQVDVDGQFGYSKVVTVATDADHISITPVPFEETITIRSDIQGEMNVIIRDVLGRITYQGDHENENGSVTIQPNLGTGAYVITIQTDTFIEQQKIIRK